MKARLWNCCRASALIAGVDAIQFGLVARRTGGYVLAALPPLEAFVSHLSDHDYVATIPAARVVGARLAEPQSLALVPAREVCDVFRGRSL